MVVVDDLIIQLPLTWVCFLGRCIGSFGVESNTGSTQENTCYVTEIPLKRHKINTGTNILYNILKHPKPFQWAFIVLYFVSNLFYYLIIYKAYLSLYILMFIVKSLEDKTISVFLSIIDNTDMFKVHLP